MEYKIIHYCWFGRNPLPPLAKKCIKSWKKFLPNYEIKEWNEDNFNVNITRYTKEAYDAKKYAFVSDYARFWILYQYGGIYFDIDVEMIRPINNIISQGPFMGCEEDVTSTLKHITVNPGLGLYAPPKLDFYKNILDMYGNLSFIDSKGNMNLTTIVSYTTELLRNYGLKDLNVIQKCGDIYIYPKDYFCPIDYGTNKLYITENTYTIHHYNASWLTAQMKIKRKLYLLIINTPILNYFFKLYKKYR